MNGRHCSPVAPPKCTWPLSAAASASVQTGGWWPQSPPAHTPPRSRCRSLRDRLVHLLAYRAQRCSTSGPPRAQWARAAEAATEALAVKEAVTAAPSVPAGREAAMATPRAAATEEAAASAVVWPAAATVETVANSGKAGGPDCCSHSRKSSHTRCWTERCCSKSTSCWVSGKRATGYAVAPPTNCTCRPTETRLGPHWRWLPRRRLPNPPDRLGLA